MEDMYVKPGNQERGWNDPPQFSYGLQMARGPQRNPLNKRAAPPTSSGAEALPAATPSCNPMAPPMCGIAPPPLPARLPPDGMATPLTRTGQMRVQREADSSQSEPDMETVMSVLNRALDACRSSVKGPVCNEVAKRLRLLEDSWRCGKLSLPVTRRMDTLTQELQAGNWDSADEIHRSLMVDHVTEVSQWMVGVKRLIAETRDLSPELLKPFQSSARPESAEPVGDSDPEQELEPEPEPAGRAPQPEQRLQAPGSQS
ncbi:steroid receptor RNA activator 1 [Fundulus heteroclitus]|uniref:Steroid receptor RNA activator 1 n=1 Tax=Fundulus heteroclitus TaxID=8078 RepID=A0A3Q2U026_FUNHE|nr:steroid receptor RNA activator 1 [Fundulus heteroclitus]